MKKHLAGALCVALTLAAAPHAARAADVNEAMQHYDRGRQLFDEGAYDAALLEFERAYKLAPTYKLLYNIGQVDRQLNDYARSLDAYERYLSEGGADVPSARQIEVRGEIAKLASRVAHITVKTNAPEGEILVDDAFAAKVPLTTPLTVNVGRRRITVSWPNHPPLARVIEVVAAESQTVDLSFVEAEPAAPKPVTPESPPSLPVVGYVVTGALGVAAIVTGAVALSKKSDNNDAVATRNADPDLIRSTNNQARTWGITTDVLWGTTIIAGCITGYFTYKYLHWKESAPVQVGVGPGSASMSIKF